MREIAITTLLCLFIISAGIVPSFAEDTIKQLTLTQTTFTDAVKQFSGKDMTEVCTGTYCFDGTVKEVNGSCLVLEKRGRKYYININHITYFEIKQ